MKSDHDYLAPPLARFGGSPDHGLFTRDEP